MIINMTPHVVNICDNNQNIIKTYPSVGSIRLSTTVEVVGSIDGVPLTKTIFGTPVGLPDFQDGIFYIVSQLVKNALPQRTDLLVPTDIVRDDNGVIIGCRAFGC